MCIKSRLALLIVLCQMPFLITCVWESAPESSVIQVNLKSDGRCLNEFGAEMRRYVQGRMSEADVAGFWDCAIQAVYDFQRLTAGDNGGSSYTPHAVRRFLYRHFLESRMISDDVLSEVMEIKRVFLSGSEQTITHEELLRLTSFLTEVKWAFLDLRPYVRILFEASAAPTDAELDQALKSVDRVARRLAVWLDRYQEPYAFSRLDGLFQALNVWMENDGDLPKWMPKVQTVLKVVPPAKYLLVGGGKDGIEGDEWAPLLSSLSGLFRAYSLGRATFAHDLNSGLVKDTLPSALEAFASVLEASTVRRGLSGIPLNEWDDFFQSLEHANLFSAPVTAAAIKPAFRWLIARLLGGASSTAVTVEHSRILAHHARRWRLLMHNTGEAESSDWARFLSVLNSSSPLAWDREGRLIQSPQGPAAWTPEAIRRMAWPFAILNWVREAYVGSNDHLSESEVNLAVHEILPLLQNFGVLLDTELTIGERLLREADLFTLSSNGDFLLDMSEAVRYLVFVASAYRTSEIWFQEADALCVDRDARCVRDLATRADSQVLQAFPELRRQVLNEPPEAFLRYMRQAEEIVLKKPVSGSMSMKDLLQVQMIFQYVETFLRAYDANRDARIYLPEAMAAYQIYGPTLAKLLSGNGLPPEDILAFFTFMMKYGDTPFAMFGGQIYFINWRLHRKDWAFSANRSTLMSILKQLSKL